MHDKRLTTRLISYWDQIRKQRVMPEIVMLNPASIEEMWKQCFLLAVLPSNQDTRQYNYEYMAPQIIEAYGRNLTGQIVNIKARTFPGSKVISKVDELILKPAPVIEEGQFVSENNKIVKFRSCLLPFGKESGEVTHIVGGVSWRTFG